MSTEKVKSGSDQVWAIIPARYASSRFPGKPLAMLAGKPMIQHVYERTEKAASISRVVVATDDARIQQAVQGFGGQAVITGEHPTGTDRIAEAVEILSAQHGKPGWVLNVQGHEPLVDANDLEALIQGLLAVPEAVMGTLVHPTRNEEERLDPNIVKAVLDVKGRALYFSRAPIPFPRKPMGPAMRHLGIYLYRIDFLGIFAKLPETPLSTQEQLEQLRALEYGYPIHCFTAQSLGLGVDVPADIQKAEALLLSRKG